MKKLTRYAVGLALVVLASPAMAWAAELATQVASGCCGLPCCK